MKKRRKVLKSNKKLSPALRKRMCLKKVKISLSKEKLLQFKKLLIRLKVYLKATLSQMEQETLSKSRREASGDLSNLPFHMADAGSDTFEQDLNLELMEIEGKEIYEIDEALDRIEDKTYGICEQCNKSISEKRLRAIPFSRLCIKCKEKEETDV